MKFGVCVATNINDWQLLVHAENEGLRPRLGAGFADDLVRLLRHSRAGGAPHLHHSSRHRRRHRRHAHRAGYRALHRLHQPHRAGGASSSASARATPPCG